MSCEKKLLLIDVDCGTDDAQAIMMAVAAPHVEILGITCVGGNTAVDNVCKNVLRVLRVCNRSDIPVFRGAFKPVLGEAIHASYFHGVDGLGDVPDQDAPDMEQIQKEHAVDALNRIVSEHPGQVTPELQIIYTLLGNTTACGEFNFLADPEGAYIVLNEFTCLTYIATWEHACRHKLSWEWYEQWVNRSTKKADFIKKIYAHSLQYSRYNEKEVKAVVAGPGFVSCDSYAMAAAIDETTVTDFIECAVTVELSGKFARGMMVLDLIGDLKKKSKARVMTGCDMEKFVVLMESSVQ
uniref:Pyrimidine-specific ribonucleoside hydrolase rihA n=1 Tax=Xenopus tropicalis TaxID=8364 RepID=A0A6I8SJ43_XENTR